MGGVVARWGQGVGRSHSIQSSMASGSLEAAAQIKKMSAQEGGTQEKQIKIKLQWS